MYSDEKVKELENKSHVRGMLSKQYYGYQQEQKQRKKQQMKQILDRQVEERRLKKQLEKQAYRQRMIKEQQEIMKYLNQKPVPVSKASGSTSHLHNSNFVSLSKENGHTSPMKNASIEHLSPKKKEQREGLQSSRRVGQQQNQEQIPVMPKFDSEEGSYANQIKDKDRNDNPGVTQIPVLNLNDDDDGGLRRRKKTKAMRETKKELRGRQSDRMETFGSRRNTETSNNNDAELENRTLKEELKRSQEALGMLMDMLRAHPELHKYKNYADRIMESKEKVQPSRMFPTLAFNKRSVMEEYLIGAYKSGKTQPKKRIS